MLVKDAEEAARLFAATSAESAAGEILVAEFTALGFSCVGVNRGPHFVDGAALSFQIATSDQRETGAYWNAIVGNGGKESMCGWFTDKWRPSMRRAAEGLCEQKAGPRR